MVRTPVILDGYVQWVYPWRIREGELYYMLGEFGCFSPVEFEAIS